MKFHKSPIEGIRVVSNDPFLGIIDDFLDDKEIKGVIDLVKDELKPSLTVNKETGEYTVSKTRTSYSAELPKHATLVQKIAEKCSTYSGYDKEQLEESIKVIEKMDENALELREARSDVNILDVVMLINLVLEGEYINAGDLNQDLSLNILDIVQLVNIILNN